MEKEQIKKEIFSKLENIKKENENIYNILKKEVCEIEKTTNNFYISYNKKYCCRCYAPIEYYFLIINKLNLKNTWIESGLSCEAIGAGFSVSWCEHDFTIAF